MQNITLLNEDGTNVIDNFPSNPLMSKWEKEFPMMESCIKIEESKLENYSCLSCDKCPKGEFFEIPKEDLKIYKKYLNELDEYNKIHNPKMYKLLRSKSDKHNE